MHNENTERGYLDDHDHFPLQVLYQQTLTLTTTVVKNLGLLSLIVYSEPQWQLKLAEIIWSCGSEV